MAVESGPQANDPIAVPAISLRSLLPSAFITKTDAPKTREGALRLVEALLRKHFGDDAIQFQIMTPARVRRVAGRRSWQCGASRKTPGRQPGHCARLS
jgi:hypothetical protein